MKKVDFIDWVKDNIPHNAEIKINSELEYSELEYSYGDKYRNDIIHIKGIAITKHKIDEAGMGE